ncbi:uncharacterized protein M421DRAFT_425075 [Didymella exigua CBS 183.55]|uniref:DDE-1 domain-containing protein n=1 Tax=Didymella exigua CBS 183.55 TaxID=1150837 RepID=A0A6A5R8K8_9PLEO|nr:uncharacterized protein M421DRAFT_425075 [Didymella exigua CBS 183.55]KAF1924062.1 hypothetical protein M421DRAFT_425075 [Didymella exigua CBS 183.55]
MPPYTSHILQPLDAFLKDNILSSFRATSLVPDNLEVVLLRLEVKPCTLTPPLPRTN